MNTWRLILFSVKMADSSEEGDAKSGNLVEEAYEYRRNVRGGCKRSMQATHTKKGSEICCERYCKKKKKGKVCSSQFG